MSSRGRSPPRSSRHRPSRSVDEDESVLSSRQLEAFGRTVHATASQLIAPLGAHESINTHYQNALGEIHRELRRPLIQRSVFSLARASPREIVRSTLSTSEVQHRALTHLPDDLLRHIPESSSTYSLFEGYQATAPEEDKEPRPHKKKHARRNSKGQKLLGSETPTAADDTDRGLGKLKNKKQSLDHRLQMMSVRKNMCISEIRDIDNKIANLNTMRKIVLDRLAGMEQEELDLEHDLSEVGNKLEDLQEQLDDAAALAMKSPVMGATKPPADDPPDTDAADASFMSDSIYGKLPSPKSDKKKRRVNRRISMPVLHEHLAQGSRIREFQAHTDIITALDFDVPFGTLVTSALDDTVRVWDLNAGRCMGMLEGHLSSVRCLQVEDNIVATGSMDASIRLWDLSQADYTPPTSNTINSKPAESHDIQEEAEDEDEDGLLFSNPAEDALPPPNPGSMADCPLFSLEAHVAEVTALNFRGNTLVSGSADKTLRQWDLEKGRCVQTLDVLWAAAQATATLSSATSANSQQEAGGWWRPTSGRLPAAEADFVGALQVFETALACGTADGMVRLWDLRSGMVHRSLVGHTGPVTALQFDDVHLVTGSADRSIRIWDLRTGSIYDAFAYDAPIASMMFDTRHIVSAIGDPVVKVYDKTDGRHWDCGAGASETLFTDAGDNEHDDFGAGASTTTAASAVERVRIKDGYLVEGRKDGCVGVWSC
ncbi:hypothetical protein MBLNU459_g2903t1 [Dothideomycetes sp. NU459]